MKIILFLVLCLFPFTGFAAASHGYTATYDVYAGGIHALQANLAYTEKDGKYEIGLTSATYGLLNSLVPWHANFTSNGWIVKGHYQPEKHVADTTSKGKHEINTYTYGKDGKFLTFKQVLDDKDVTRSDLDPAIMQNTTDVLSANFNMMYQLAEKGSCTHEDMIFDSERSYRLMFKDSKKETLTPNKYSSFEGEAQSCSVEVKPEGGQWHKKPRGWLKIQEQARSNGTLPTLWYSNLLKGKDEPSVPVRILIKTNYGTFIAHLMSFQEK